MKPIAALAGLALLLAGCQGASDQNMSAIDANSGDAAAVANGGDAAASARVAVTIEGSGGRHIFTVERARTAEEQARGLMYRTDLTPDGGMLFYPYPAEGGGPQVANFWMKNTPTPLDIIFIRADGTIARIAENTVPFSESPVTSNEPVAAVLEIVGGRAAELGIAEGDKVDWAGRK